MPEVQDRIEGLEPSIDPNTRLEIQNKYMRSAAGRTRIASKMIQPLRERRDYTAVGRRGFWVNQLPDGALPIYHKDVDVTAFVIGEEGQGIVQIQRPKTVLFPIFTLQSVPQIDILTLKEKRYDVLRRMQSLAKAEIQAREDIRVFSVYRAASLDPAARNPIISVSAPLTPAILADAFARVEDNSVRVARVFLNARDFADFRKFNRDILDIESQGHLLKTGLMANMWGAQIITSRVIDPGTVILSGEPEFVGRIPVRTELTVLTADDNVNRLVGFSIFEHLGIGIHNQKATQIIEVAR